MNDFDERGWLVDFGDKSRTLHSLCETWLYHHAASHPADGGCERCEDVEAILQALRDSHLIKWEGVFDRVEGPQESLP